MGFWSRAFGREERAAVPAPSVVPSSSPEEWFAFLGLTGSGSPDMPVVTIETALQVPAVADAVGFLSRSLASLPLHTYRKGEGSEPARADGDIQMLLNEAPNPDWSSYGWRLYMWQQVFTGGRGATWIERNGITPVALWPLDPTQTTVKRVNGRKFFTCGGIDYPAADVIDIPFMLRADQIGVWSPIYMARKAISLAIAMGDFAGGFFSGGGVPPLALEGPLPEGIDGFRRAQDQIKRAIDLAKQSGSPFFGMPPGHKLSPVGTDPDKGQMVEARLFQIQEIARVWGLPPVFLQDLSRATFTNAEQQDLHLAKHCIAQWAKAFEDELNLKLFGQRRRARWAEHNLDGLMRGDLLSRLKAIGSAIQTAQLTPNEARALENRPPKPKGDDLYVQGATVKLGTDPTAAIGHNGGPPLDDDQEKDPDAATD